MDICDRLRDEVTDADGRLDATLLDAVAEIDRLREAIRRLADQDATLSLLCKRDGTQVVTVTMDATLTPEEREAIYRAEARLRTAYVPDDEVAATLRGLLKRTQ